MHRLACLLILCSCASTNTGPVNGDPPDGGSWTPIPDARIPPGWPDSGVTATDAGPSITELCFPPTGSGDIPDYAQFGTVPGSHCLGTNHQDITGVEKLVFVGDSITEGSPPTLPTQYYRTILTDKMRERFGADLEVAECAAWGARMDDLLLEPHLQLPTCFPAPESKRTLIVMTVGGNDMNAIAQDAMDGATLAASMAAADEALALHRAALEWIREPGLFPNGVFVIGANVYEYTDGMGDPDSCPGAILAGLGGEWPDGRPVYIHFNEGLIKNAVETGGDAIFLLETFCGHGFHAGDPASECFQGEDAEQWFDLTCIHPNPTGHAQIADMFTAVVDE